MQNQSKPVTIFDVVMTLIVLFILTPCIPICAILILIFYKTKIKTSIPAVISGLILIVMVFFTKEYPADFIAICAGKILSIINIPKSLLLLPGFDFSDYFIMLNISVLISCYLTNKLNNNKLLEKAGIKNFEKLTKIIAHNSEKPLSKEKVGDKTFIGTNDNRRKVYCLDNAKHALICGTTGSGKTVALSNFIHHAIKQDYGMLLIDGKGDTGAGSILEITQTLCAENNKKLYIINMNEPLKSNGYNPFNGANSTVVKDMLVNMSDWSEEHYKANTERYLQRVVSLMKLKEIPLSFGTILKFIDDDEFIQLSAYAQKDNIINKEQHIENNKLAKECSSIIKGAVARFATIAEGETGNIFKANGINIADALNEGAIVLFVLNPLLYPETSVSLGRLALIDAKQAVSKLFNKNNRRTFFIFDEINVYASKTLLDLVNKSRSASVTCLLACQSLSDLSASVDEDFKEQVIENCNNYIVLRQNSYKNAEEWAKVIGTTETMQVTYQLKESEATELGTAKRVREFKMHPDDIKSLRTGEAIFLSKDTQCFEHVRIYNPNITNQGGK